MHTCLLYPFILSFLYPFLFSLYFKSICFLFHPNFFLFHPSFFLLSFSFFPSVFAVFLPLYSTSFHRKRFLLLCGFIYLFHLSWCSLNYSTMMKILQGVALRSHWIFSSNFLLLLVTKTIKFFVVACSAKCDTRSKTK